MEILSWRYAPPYDIYNFSVPDVEVAIAHLLQPELHFLAVLDASGEMIAFRCYGADARVPGGNYSAEALDLGGGLRPDLTGQGLGQHVIAAAMKYGLQNFSPRHFRTTVASFNLRARKVCQRLGYRVTDVFTRASDGVEFQIFMQGARPMPLSIPAVASCDACGFTTDRT